MKVFLLLFIIILTSCTVDLDDCVTGVYKRTELPYDETVIVKSNYTYIHSFKEQEHHGTWHISEIDNNYIVFEDWVVYQSPFNDELGEISGFGSFADCEVIEQYDLSEFHFYKIKE